MKPPLENIRVSQRSGKLLIALKRKTGIRNWNILCRWAFCDSLATPDRPGAAIGSAESTIEMSWDTFAGDLGDYLLAALATRAAKDGVGPGKPEMASYFRSHLERGISQLGRIPQPSLQAMIVLRKLSAYSPPGKSNDAGQCDGEL
jgi:DNA sulfur modification protein DndE